MKIKIISDGTANGTKVVNAETGELVHHVSSVEWKVSVESSLAEAVVTFSNVAVEIEAELSEVV